LFSEKDSERLEAFADRVMIEPTWFDFYTNHEEDVDEFEEGEDEESEEE
jgi:hypothetical protein